MKYRDGGFHRDWAKQHLRACREMHTGGEDKAQPPLHNYIWAVDSHAAVPRVIHP